MAIKKKNKRINLDAVQLINRDLGMPLISAAMLSARGINKTEDVLSYIDSSSSKLSDPMLIASMEIASIYILKAMGRNEKILIFGDFDTDGITSTSIFLRFFRALSYRNVDYKIPSESEGHGLSVKTIDELNRLGVKLIITADNGTNSKKEVDYAKSRGISTIITDHHLPDKNFADSAIAVINPKRSDCFSPFKLYSGAGIALMLCNGIAKSIRREDYITNDLFVLASISTIADMVPLVGDNRLIVQKGLEFFNDSGIVGLSLLMDSLYMTGPEGVSSRDVAFRIAPTINAAAKMGISDRAITMLTGSERFAINSAIKEVIGIAARRRTLVSEAYEVLIEAAKTKSLEQNGFLYLSGNHKSAISGLLANKIMETYKVPVFIGSTDSDKDEIKVSSRSPDGAVNLSLLIESMSDIVLFGGGHERAAGFSIKKENETKLPDRILESIKSLKSESVIEHMWEIDGEIVVGQIDSALIKSFHMMAPFGKGNEAPLLSIINVDIKRELRSKKVSYFISCPYGKIPVVFSESVSGFSNSPGLVSIIAEFNFKREALFLTVREIEVQA